MSRSDELQRHHNDGEQDAANGDYKSPHGPADLIGGKAFSGKSDSEMDEDNDAYDSGHRNHRNQTG